MFYIPPAESKILTKYAYSVNSREKTLENQFGFDTYPILTSKNVRSLLRFLASILFKEKSEILLPAYTCESVIYAFINHKIKLYDLERETLAPSLNSVKENITGETKAIVIQDLFGLNINLHKVIEYAKSRNLIVIFDSSQYLSDEVANIRLGDFQLFSFGRGKPLPLGMGGMLRINNNNFDHLVTDYNPQTTVNTASSVIKMGLIQVLVFPVLYSAIEKAYLSKRKKPEKFSISDYVCSSFPLLPSILKGSSIILSTLNRHRKKVASFYNSVIDNRDRFQYNNGSIFIRFPYFSSEQKLPKKLYKLGVRHMYINTIALAEKYPNISTNSNLKNSTCFENHLLTLPTHTDVTLKVAAKVVKLLNQG